MAIESGKYVSQNDPGRGAATIFQYGNTNYDSLFNAMRQKRYDDRAIMESKRKEVNDLISTVQEEVWKYDTEKFQSMMNEFTNDVKETYAKSDKGDYYDVSPIDQIRLRAKLNKINTFADKSMQDKKNSDEAEAILGRNLKNVDMDAFKQHWQTEIGKEPGTRDFINFPWINTKEPEEVKYGYGNVKAMTHTSIDENDAVTITNKGITGITDAMVGVYAGAENGTKQLIEQEAMENGYSTDGKVLGGDLKRYFSDAQAGKIKNHNNNTQFTTLKAISTSGMGTEYKKTEDEEKKGFSFIFNGGGTGQNGDIRYSSARTEMPTVVTTSKDVANISTVTIEINPINNTLWNRFQAPYTGGFYSPTAGKWEGTIGEKVDLPNPSFKYAKQILRGKKLNESPAGFWVFSKEEGEMGVAREVPATPAVLAAMAIESKNTSVEDYKNIMLDGWVSQTQGAKIEDYEIFVNNSGFYAVRKKRNASATATNGQDKQQGNKETNTGGAY